MFNEMSNCVQHRVQSGVLMDNNCDIIGPIDHQPPVQVSVTGNVDYTQLYLWICTL